MARRLAPRSANTLRRKPWPRRPEKRAASDRLPLANFLFSGPWPRCARVAEGGLDSYSVRLTTTLATPARIGRWPPVDADGGKLRPLSALPAKQEMNRRKIFFRHGRDRRAGARHP